VDVLDTIAVFVLNGVPRGLIERNEVTVDIVEASGLLVNVDVFVDVRDAVSETVVKTILLPKNRESTETWSPIPRLTNPSIHKYNRFICMYSLIQLKAYFCLIHISSVGIFTFITLVRFSRS
jgi:hypothetical protein